MADLTGAARTGRRRFTSSSRPTGVDTQRTWLRLMITAGIRLSAENRPAQKYRCLFLIDEFAALGKLDISIATMSGYGIDYA